MKPPAALRTPLDVHAHLVPYFEGAKVEHFVAVVLDVRNRPIHTEVVGKGAVDSCHVDVRSVFHPAILHLGSAVIVAHNHPSGDPTPSPEDLTLTKRLVDAGKLLGVPVLDHIILATGRYAQTDKPFVSLAETGVMS